MCIIIEFQDEFESDIGASRSQLLTLHYSIVSPTMAIAQVGWAQHEGSSCASVTMSGQVFH